MCKIEAKTHHGGYVDYDVSESVKDVANGVNGAVRTGVPWVALSLKTGGEIAIRATDVVTISEG